MSQNETPGNWVDLPKICISTMFPNLCLHDADAEMVEVAKGIEAWFKRTARPELTVRWINVLDFDTNPKADVGFIRIFNVYGKPRDPSDAIARAVNNRPGRLA